MTRRDRDRHKTIERRDADRARIEVFTLSDRLLRCQIREPAVTARQLF